MNNSPGMSFTQMILPFARQGDYSHGGKKMQFEFGILPTQLLRAKNKNVGGCRCKLKQREALHLWLGRTTYTAGHVGGYIAAL